MVVNGEGKMPLYLGIDGGGSKCRAVIVGSDGAVLGRGLGGPANPHHGLEQSLNSIRTATEAALHEAGLPLDSARRLNACLGLAGVNLPSVHQAMLGWQHEYEHLLVATDLRVACVGAHGGSDGAVIIAGTGSVGYAHVAGQDFMVGGHGFPCGDPGSGAWMGLEATKHVLLNLDGLAEATVLTERLLAHAGATDALGLVEHSARAGAKGYAKLAPLVIDAAAAGDPVADHIVSQGAAYLSAVARKLLQHQPPRLSILGGLSGRIVAWMAADVVAHLSPPLEQPEMGAARLAMLTFAPGSRH